MNYSPKNIYQYEFYTYPTYILHTRSIGWMPYIKADADKDMDVMEDEQGRLVHLANFIGAKVSTYYDKETGAIDAIKAFFGTRAVSMDFKRDAENKRLKGLMRKIV